MAGRKIGFKFIVGAVICLFMASAILSVATIRAVWSPKYFATFWFIITVLSQGPFILIPLDRGRLIRLIMEKFPQGVIQLILTVTLTNLIMLPLELILILLPHPNRFYDILPFVLLAGVGLNVFRSANRIVERRFTLPVDGLSPQWKGITILHLSDIHAGPFLGPERLEHVIRRINEKGGFDLCVITGDVVNHNSEDLTWVLPILEKIQAPLGTFVTLGNHEYIDDEHKIIKLYEKSQLSLLRDNSVLLSDGIHNLRLIGIDYPFESYQVGRDNIEKALKRSLHYSSEIDGEMRILLSHHPEGYVEGRRLGIPLTLAGHTHGGQIILFGKNIISPFVRYKRGIYRKADKYLYVNSGLGNWMPFRINCPCEFALITIVKKEELGT